MFIESLARSPWCAHPEGRRSPDGQLKRIRRGIGILLTECPVGAVPVIIEGSFEAMPIGRAIPRPHPITVRLGRPVTAEELARKGQGEERREKITSAVEDELKALASGGA